jgi:translation initiation factor IF-3
MIRVPEVRLVGDNVADIAEELGIDLEAGSVVDTRTAKCGPATWALTW